MPLASQLPAKKSSKILVSAALTALLTLGTACGGGGTSNSSAGNQTLVANTSFVYKTLDPGRAYEQTGYVALHSLYSTLMTFDGDDITKPVPELAESVEASADTLTHTFKLREGTTFADGSPITSEDVVFSLTRLQNLKGSSAPFFAGLTFEAPDARTVVVKSDKASPNLPVLMAMPASSIVNSKVVKEKGGTNTPDAATADTAQSYLDSASAGSGPYVLERNDPGQELVLAANDKYWGEKPAYGRVVLRNIDIQNQKLTLSRSKSPEIALDLTGNLLKDLPESLNVSEKKDNIFFAWSNADPTVSPISSNPGFVAAFKSAVDYEGIAALMGPGGSTLGGLIADVYPGSLPSSEGPKQNIDQAKKLLADAGISEPTVPFIYPAITYRGVDLGTIATKIQGDVAKAGIKLELTPQPLTAFLEGYRGGKSVMGMTPHALSYPRAENFVTVMRPGGTNSTRVGWTVERASAAAVEASNAVFATTSDEGRTEKIVDWQKVMKTDSPFIPLGVNSGAIVSTPQVADAKYTSAGWIVDLADIKAAG
jgi:peptide/nickel transport system substrate-binding protein